MRKKLAVWLSLALVFAFIPAIAEVSPFADAQLDDPVSPENDDSGWFSLGDFNVEQPTLTPPPPDVQPLSELVYRDGVKFGMTIDDVKGLEKNQPAEEHWQKNYGGSDTYYIKYTGEDTLGIACDIEYHFTDSSGTLVHIMVRLAVPSALTYDGIAKRDDQYIEIDHALIEKYGPADGPPSYNYGGLGGLEEATVWSAARSRNFRIKHAFLTDTYGSRHYVAYHYVDPGERGGV